MKWEVKMYVGGTVFTESVHAVNREDAVDTAKNRNPHARIIGVKLMQTLKRYYINVKFEKYGTYTFEARSKEHAIQIYNDGDYGWSDYSEDFGEFNEVIEDVEEEVFADTQLSLEGVM